MENKKEENESGKLDILIPISEKIKAIRAAKANDMTLSQLVRALLRNFYNEWESGTVGAFKFEQDSINDAVKAVKTQATSRFKPLTQSMPARPKMGGK